MPADIISAPVMSWWEGPAPLVRFRIRHSVSAVSSATRVLTRHRPQVRHVTHTHTFTTSARVSHIDYRTRRKARCPIGTDLHVSPGRW
eukprot:483373-Prymnesium_polylepis.1